MRNYLKRPCGIVTVLTLAMMLFSFSQNVQAMAVEFFGEDLSPNKTVPPGGNAATAQSMFLANLVGIGIEDFESFAYQTTAPLNLTFPGSSGSITATLSGNGSILDSNHYAAGRFPTSGTNLWNVDPPGSPQDIFSITFSSPISAFGFYGTDIGDFGGQITLELKDGNTTTLTIPNTISAPDGALLFYGFYDTENSYTKIIFGNTAGSDGFGFDDMIVGDLKQIQPVPEPGTMLLLGSGLIVIAGYGRKKLFKK